MKQPKVTRVTRLQSLPVHSRPGFSIVSVIIVIALIAIAAGLLLPKIAPKRRIPAAFDEVGVGRMEGNVCTNDYFGLSIHVPEGWQVMSRDDLKSYMTKRNRSDQQNVAIVLMAARPLKPAPGVAEPILSVAARRLSSVPEVKDVADLMRRAQRSREKGNLNYGDPGRPYKASIGGEACLRLDAKQRQETGIVDTAMCCLLRQGYGLSVLAEWQTEEDRRALMQSLQTVQFK